MIFDVENSWGLVGEQFECLGAQSRFELEGREVDDLEGVVYVSRRTPWGGRSKRSRERMY